MEDGDGNLRVCELIIKGADCKGVIIFSNATILFVYNANLGLSSINICVGKLFVFRWAYLELNIQQFHLVLITPSYYLCI